MNRVRIAYATAVTAPIVLHVQAAAAHAASWAS